jgi:hypothetical protein
MKAMTTEQMAQVRSLVEGLERGEIDELDFANRYLWLMQISPNQLVQGPPLFTFKKQGQRTLCVREWSEEAARKLGAEVMGEPIDSSWERSRL